jgi:hypothetical protein
MKISDVIRYDEISDVIRYDEISEQAVLTMLHENGFSM